MLHCCLISKNHIELKLLIDNSNKERFRERFSERIDLLKPQLIFIYSRGAIRFFKYFH